MNRTRSGKILLHTETELTKEIAEQINEAVGKIGPVQLAGMGLVKKMEHTAGALEEGLEKIEEANQEMKEAIPDKFVEAAANLPDPENILENLDRLRRENAELREKINFSDGKN